MNRCIHDDCFSCPYPDCIRESQPKKPRRKRQKLSKNKARLHKSESNKKYYYKNQAKIRETQRLNYIAKKKKQTENG